MQHTHLPTTPLSYMCLVPRIHEREEGGSWRSTVPIIFQYARIVDLHLKMHVKEIFNLPSQKTYHHIWEPRAKINREVILNAPGYFFDIIVSKNAHLRSRFLARHKMSEFCDISWNFVHEICRNFVTWYDKSLIFAEQSTAQFVCAYIQSEMSVSRWMIERRSTPTRGARQHPGPP